MDSIEHYGIKRKSGRYPWGSGKDPYQRASDFRGMVQELKDKGLTPTEISKALGMTTTELRVTQSFSSQAVRDGDIRTAVKLRDKNMSVAAIARQMNKSPSHVSNLLKYDEQDKISKTTATADLIRSNFEKHPYIDIGAGNEKTLGITRSRLNLAVAELVEEGYEVWYLRVPQVGTGNMTSVKTLSPPGTPWKEVNDNRDNLGFLTAHSDDSGLTFREAQPPKKLDHKRVRVVYGPDGGNLKDGVIEVAPGAKDIDLGSSRYAQVRIATDNDLYLKGVLMYNTDLKGDEVVFYTNKDPGTPLEKVLKPMPWSAVIKAEGQRGALNIVNEEGDWAKWSKNLSSQMLSKQPTKLAETQLNELKTRRENELNEALALDNPSVKRKILQSIADEADSASVSLHAAGIKGTATHVILPIPKMKETEVYAPNYRDGEKVVLIRHPHGGIFEIPELIVNNSNRAARKAMGVAKDAIGIHPNVAEQLSGADFDGDTVLVIPNQGNKIITKKPLDGLKNFDPKRTYREREGMKYMTNTQTEMGKISNLVTDMTIRGATDDEIAKAVRHSMVVIDAEKHKLDYTQSAIDNSISTLKKKYQGSAIAGASTIISRSSGDKQINRRKPRPFSEGGPIDKESGKLRFVDKEPYVDRETGELKYQIEKVPRMSLTDDAHTLSSGTPIETIYANHANDMKSIANRARKAMVETENIPYSRAAAATYKAEVASLTASLDIALQNAPRERKAQIVAGVRSAAILEANPDLDKGKIQASELKAAREALGAHKEKVPISDREWEAIQAGAVSASKLDAIIANSDLDRVKSLATPKASRPSVSTAALARAKTLLRNGYTQAQVADALGISLGALRGALE